MAYIGGSVFYNLKLWLYGIVGAAILALAGTVAYQIKAGKVLKLQLSAQKAAVEALETQNRALQAGIAKRNEAIKRQRSESERIRKELEAALSSNPGWRDEKLPEEVLRALQP
jgi:hypothetical protein